MEIEVKQNHDNQKLSKKYADLGAKASSLLYVTNVFNCDILCKNELKKDVVLQLTRLILRELSERVETYDGEESNEALSDGE